MTDTNTTTNTPADAPPGGWRRPSCVFIEGQPLTLCAHHCPVELAAVVAAFSAPAPIVSAESGSEVGAVVDLQLLHGPVADVVTATVEAPTVKSGALLAPVYVGDRLARLDVVGQLSDPFANVPRGVSGARWLRAAARRHVERNRRRP